MKRYLKHMILLILLSACVKEAEWDAHMVGAEYIVVEAIMTNEYRVQYLHLHHNKLNLNDTKVPLSGAEVIISNEDETYQLIEDPEEAGRYITDTVIVARFSKNYSLLIYYNNRFYSAQSYMVPGKTFAELTYKKNDDDEMYHIDYVASAFEAENAAMWEIKIDWSIVPGYESLDPESCRRTLLFYTLPTLDVSQVFAPLVEQV